MTRPSVARRHEIRSMYACRWTAVHVLRYAIWARAGILPHPLAPPSDATHDATRNTTTTDARRRPGRAHALRADRRARRHCAQARAPGRDTYDARGHRRAERPPHHPRTPRLPPAA